MLQRRRTRGGMLLLQAHLHPPRRMHHNPLHPSHPMTSPNQTPDALRAVIANVLGPRDDLAQELHDLGWRSPLDAQWTSLDAFRSILIDRLATAIAPFLAPPLTPDASTTGKGETHAINCLTADISKIIWCL